MLDVKRAIREVKNVAGMYSVAEQLVREVTCNDENEPRESDMREIARATFTVELDSIMAIIWKRIGDKTGERHPYKCLVLIESNNFN